MLNFDVKQIFLRIVEALNISSYQAQLRFGLLVKYPHSYCDNRHIQNQQIADSFRLYEAIFSLWGHGRLMLYYYRQASQNKLEYKIRPFRRQIEHLISKELRRTPKTESAASKAVKGLILVGNSVFGRHMLLI